MCGSEEEVAPPTDGSDCCCAICLKDMDGHDKLRAMPCSHAFHQDCIFMWLHRNATCPLCRHQLPTEEADNEEEEEVRRIGIFLERVNRLHNVLEQQLQRIRILSERLDRWLNLAEEHRQMIRSQSST